MTKIINTVGLDTIGHKHWMSEDEILFKKRLSKPMPQTINRRSKSSSTKRKVKITLPDCSSFLKEE